MNGNESDRLTPKQQELVKRLEQIRQNKETIKKDATKDTAKKQANEVRGRNAKVKQKRKQDKQLENKVPRPNKEIMKKVTPVEPFTARKQKQKVRKKENKKIKKKSSDLLRQLSHGKSLAQAISLNEILDKPVSLRRK